MKQALESYTSLDNEAIKCILHVTVEKNMESPSEDNKLLAKWYTDIYLSNHRIVYVVLVSLHKESDLHPNVKKIKATRHGQEVFLLFNCLM